MVTVLQRTLRFSKSFFDDKEVGYLMSRLSTDVEGLRWFFSSTLVYIVSNVFRFVGSRNEEVGNATVEFSATAPVLAYASVIDNASNDPVVAIPCADSGTPQP